MPSTMEYDKLKMKKNEPYKSTENIEVVYSKDEKKKIRKKKNVKCKQSRTNFIPFAKSNHSSLICSLFVAVGWKSGKL